MERQRRWIGGGLDCPGDGLFGSVEGATGERKDRRCGLILMVVVVLVVVDSGESNCGY